MAGLGLIACCLLLALAILVNKDINDNNINY